jgi:hypothetical protein
MAPQLVEFMLRLQTIILNRKAMEKILNKINSIGCGIILDLGRRYKFYP